jgi:hypothetical protein
MTIFSRRRKMAATLMTLTSKELTKLSAAELEIADSVVRQEIATSPEIRKILRSRLDAAMKERSKSKS